jgi:hypothetical protein
LLPSLATERVLDAAVPILGENRLWRAVERGLALSGATIPQESAQVFKKARAQAALRNLRLVDLARRTLPRLAEEGIRAVVFKGPFLNRQLHGDTFFRPTSDLDVLVARRQFAQAVRVLEEGGLRSISGQASSWWRYGLGEVHLRHPTGGTIDLHHRVQQPGCPLARRSVDFLRAVPDFEMVGEARIPVLRPRIALLLSALNLLKGLMQREPSGDYALDVAAGMRALDQSELAQLGAFAHAQGLLQSMKVALAVTEATFGIELQVPAILRPEGGREAILPQDWPVETMVLRPDDPGLEWPRRRRLLWAMSEGHGTFARAGNYTRDAAQALGSEVLRLATSAPAAPAPAR